MLTGTERTTINESRLADVDAWPAWIAWLAVAFLVVAVVAAVVAAAVVAAVAAVAVVVTTTSNEKLLLLFQSYNFSNIGPGGWGGVVVAKQCCNLLHKNLVNNSKLLLVGG